MKQMYELIAGVMAIEESQITVESLAICKVTDYDEIEKIDSDLNLSETIDAYYFIPQGFGETMSVVFLRECDKETFQKVGMSNFKMFQP